MEKFDYYLTSLAGDNLKRSATLYGKLYMGCATERYSAEREEASAAARGLLDATDSMRSLEPSLLGERPTYLELLSCACLPPLTREKLSALSGVPARRIAAIEGGVSPKRGKGELQRQSKDLPAVTDVVASALDPCLAPWLADDREAKGYEAERFCAMVGDRAAQRRVSHVSYSRMVPEAACSMLRDWLDSHGYSYQEQPDTRCDALVTPRNGGTPVGLDVKIFADAVYASKLKDRLIHDSELFSEKGITTVYILCGCFSIAFVMDLEKAGVLHVWLHDLDKLDTLLQGTLSTE